MGGGRCGEQLVDARARVAAALGATCRRLWRRKDIEQVDEIVLDLVAESLVRLGSDVHPSSGKSPAVVLRKAPSRVADLVSHLLPLASAPANLQASSVEVEPGSAIAGCEKDETHSVCSHTQDEGEYATAGTFTLPLLSEEESGDTLENFAEQALDPCVQKSPDVEIAAEVGITPVIEEDVDMDGDSQVGCLGGGGSACHLRIGQLPRKD